MLSRFLLSAAAVALTISTAFASQDSLNIHVFDDASPKYKQMVQKLSDQIIDQKQFLKELVNFAYDGEPSALQSLCDMRPSFEKKRDLLHSIIIDNPLNTAAMQLLALLYNNQKDPECLRLFEMAASQPQKHLDPDFWCNYAAAILEFAESTEHNLRRSWQLIQDWPFAWNEKNVPYTCGLLMGVMERAAAGKHTDLVCDMWGWNLNHAERDLITRPLFDAISGTPYVDVIQRRFDIPIVRVDAAKHKDGKSLLAATVEAILAVNKAIGENDKAIIENAANIVKGNLEALLQNPIVRGIPKHQANARHFENFNPAEPTKAHIKMWAYIIVRDNRADLIRYANRDVVQEDFLKLIDNKTLHNICIKALEEMFFVD